MTAARSTDPHNRLARETSPYLQQHATNPVDWYPWGPEALERAKREDKPILLSIGYSACHWCHVMAHESFEDLAIAAVMNERFINIKVDREERPDIDQIYQTAHQMLTQRSGGWPLTMFLAPDQVPFFGGTYFPKTPRHNLPGFVNIMERVERAFHEKRSDITKQNAAIVEAFGRGDQADQPAAPSAFSVDVIEQAIEGLAERFDIEHGGFGEAPKFPHSSDLALLLRHSAGHRDEVSAAASAHIALLTLRKMAEGGIYDHLGGGFCRYSVDRYWMIPHFEKMLYDNGPLLSLYTDAWRVTSEPLFAQIVAETAGWVMREMQSPEGGYYSSLDADSEGEEGKFYRWTQEEARALLPPAEFAIVEQYYGLVGHANFEGHYWHLNIVQSLAQTAEKCGVSTVVAQSLLDAARVRLLAARERRIRPGRDEKILTSWNALAIAGMARAGIVFSRPEWIASARRAMDFLQRRLWQDGRLLATYKDDRAHLSAYLDDYATMIAALLELAQAGAFAADDLAFAQSLADVLLAQFEDPESGGFFFTANDHEQLIHRPKQ
ncbi:MAG: thioredoxin domain-containing protein, partial [Burkholderiales bacterium]